MSTTRTVLIEVMSGDVKALARLIDVPQDQLVEAARGLELALTRESLARALRKLGNHEVDGTDAQQWASFVRRGLGAGPSTGPVAPLDIDFQAAFEDDIIEIVARLDEIGDLIDGDGSDPG